MKRKARATSTKNNGFEIDTLSQKQLRGGVMGKYSRNIESALLADGELYEAEPKRVEVSDKALTVVLRDGRTVSAPLRWYPRLVHATPKERANCELGVWDMHWPDLDEDISVR